MFFVSIYFVGPESHNPSLIPGRAIFYVARTELFWLCLLAIVVVALLPRFVVKFSFQYYSPCDVQIAREAEKYGDPRDIGAVQREMDRILDCPQR